MFSVPKVLASAGIWEPRAAGSCSGQHVPTVTTQGNKPAAQLPGVKPKGSHSGLQSCFRFTEQIYNLHQCKQEQGYTVSGYLDFVAIVRGGGDFGSWKYFVEQRMLSFF